MKTIGVFCSSSQQVAPMFLSDSEKFGRELGLSGFKVLYGGSIDGPMGSFADGVISSGAPLIGVIPEMDFMTGIVHPKLSEKIMVETLAARKTEMILRSDAFVVMPGGIGTLDEVTEVLALNQVGATKKPVVFYNFLNAWSPLLEAFDLMHRGGFLYTSPSELFEVFDKSSDVVQYLQHVFRNS